MCVSKRYFLYDSERIAEISGWGGIHIYLKEDTNVLGFVSCLHLVLDKGGTGHIEVTSNYFHIREPATLEVKDLQDKCNLIKCKKVSSEKNKYIGKAFWFSHYLCIGVSYIY